MGPPRSTQSRTLTIVGAVAVAALAAGCGGGNGGASGPATVTVTTKTTTATTVTVTTGTTTTGPRAATATIPWPPPGLKAGTPILRTPSGNIECTVDPSKGFGAVCNATRHEWTLPPKPASCEFEWTDAVFLGPTGRPRFRCASDAAFYSGEAWPRFEFPYGSRVVGGGVTCTSRVSGVTCTNRQRHGFALSRQRVTFF